MRILLPCTVLLFGCVPLGPAPSRNGGTTSRPVGFHPARVPDAPDLKRLPNGHYRVRQPWTVEINGHVWQVQKGYTSNGITAPDYLKKNLGDGIQYKETWAAVFHDWLFTQAGVSRAQADRTFYDLLIAYGISKTKAELMYTTVSAYTLTKSKKP